MIRMIVIAILSLGAWAAQQILPTDPATEPTRVVDLYPSEGETETEALFAELRSAEGETVPWFVAGAQSRDEDELKSEIAALRSAVKELHQEKQRLEDVLTDQRAERHRAGDETKAATRAARELERALELEGRAREQEAVQMARELEQRAIEYERAVEMMARERKRDSAQFERALEEQALQLERQAEEWALQHERATEEYAREAECQAREYERQAELRETQAEKAERLWAREMEALAETSGRENEEVQREYERALEFLEQQMERNAEEYEHEFGRAQELFEHELEKTQEEYERAMERYEEEMERFEDEMEDVEEAELFELFELFEAVESPEGAQHLRWEVSSSDTADLLRRIERLEEQVEKCRRGGCCSDVEAPPAHRCTCSCSCNSRRTVLAAPTSPGCHPRRSRLLIRTGRPTSPAYRPLPAVPAVPAVPTIPAIPAIPAMPASPPAPLAVDPVSWSEPALPVVVNATALGLPRPVERVDVDEIRAMLSEMVREVRELRGVVRDLRGDARTNHFTR